MERTNLSKDTSIFVLEIGDEGCVLASSPSKIEKLKELNKEDISEIYEMKESHGISLENIDVEKFKVFNFNFNKRNKNNMFSKKKKSKFVNFNNSDRPLFNKK